MYFLTLFSSDGQTESCSEAIDLKLTYWQPHDQGLEKEPEDEPLQKGHPQTSGGLLLNLGELGPLDFEVVKTSLFPEIFFPVLAHFF